MSHEMLEIILIAYFALDILVTVAHVGKSYFITPALAVSTVIFGTLMILCVLAL